MGKKIVNDLREFLFARWTSEHGFGGRNLRKESSYHPIFIYWYTRPAVKHFCNLRGDSAPKKSIDDSFLGQRRDRHPTCLQGGSDVSFGLPLLLVRGML